MIDAIIGQNLGEIMDTNQSNYVIVEDFLTPEECQAFKEAVLNQCEEDAKPLFRYLHLANGVGSTEPIKNDWDVNNKLQAVVDYAQKHFTETYTILGTLEFNRIFGNVMETGSKLPSHRDEDPNMNGEFDGKKRSFVAGLFVNDDYGDGELLFEDQGAALKPKAGTLVLFPGFYTNHGVNEITSGLRINILTFFYDMVDCKSE